MSSKDDIPDHMTVRGARVHNLKNLTLKIPLHQIVGIAGRSGSGKSSLALGVLYAEGSRRYLESLSTYTRRRMTGAARALCDEVVHVPAALALRQRPASGGIRSTFGTGTELLNSLRLLFSRAGSHRCPNGHYLKPSLKVAAEQELECPECRARFFGPGAEDLAFNSRGACPRCSGTGIVRTVDESTLVPDESLSIDEGAVLPWKTLMWSLMTDVCRAMGVRTDVPFRELSEKERDIVFHGPAIKKHIFYKARKGDSAGELDFTYYSAVRTVENALSKVKDESGMKRVERFLKTAICPECHGSRLSEQARAPRIDGRGLDEICRVSLDELVLWMKGVPGGLDESMRPMAEAIVESFLDTAARLLDLGLGYLSLDRAASTLSNGERQRMALARAVRNRSNGVMYVLDEPSIGLHPDNLRGLNAVMDDLKHDGNSVIVVDHDVKVLEHADHLIEMGPGSGEQGGSVIAMGSVDEVRCAQGSVIAPFLRADPLRVRPEIADEEVFKKGTIVMRTRALHTVKPLEVRIPKGHLTAVTGVSGSGKTTMVLECLVPALLALSGKEELPPQVESCEAPGISRVRLIDATPIGINVRSTVATYAEVHDELRRAFARSPDAKALGCKAGDFSYNTGSLRCPECDGTGQVSLDVQFLPDVDIPCPLCRGSRYSQAARLVKFANSAGAAFSMPEIMDASVEQALQLCAQMKGVRSRLEILADLGLSYLTLGEETPALSGGEAQRLKLACEMGRGQEDTVFVFDEPTIGLHPLDVRSLLEVFERLICRGATVVVIEHDLDVIVNADHVIDMGPGGGERGGRVVVQGSVERVRRCPESVTGRYL